MLHLKSGYTTRDLEGCTAVVPSYSIVNAAQLAVDVLIASKKMTKIGQIFDDSLVPIFGHSAFEHDVKDRAAACELYADTKSKVLVIQFRTMMVIEYGLQFHKWLAKTLKDLKVERVVIISYAVHYEHEGSPIQYEASESFKKSFQSDLDAAKWQEYAKTEIMGGGNDKLLYKVFEMHDLPQITELTNDFLKAGQDFKLELPIGWKDLFENETKERMY